MLVPSIPRFRRRRGRPGRRASAPPLALVSAVYLDAPRRIRLAFVRAIDIAAIDGSQIFVDDGNFGVRYVGTGPAALFDPTTVDVELNELEPFAGADVHLTATAATGIVALDDAAAWGGVTNLLVPP